MKWDLIVIGSGIGGMSCATACAKTGKKVLLLEQHFVLGGMTHTFKRKDFLWDVGVHCVGEMSENRMPGRLIRWLTNNKIELNKYGNVYDTFNMPGNFKFELPSSREEFKANLLKAFPEEEKAIDQYLNLVNQVGKTAKAHFAHRLMPLWLEKLSAPIFDKGYKKWATKTTKEVLDGITKNEKLKAILVGQWGYYGLPPSKSSFFVQALVARHFWEGGYYPVGSSKTIADLMVKVLEENGGKAMARTEVKELIFEGDKVVGVRTTKGEEFFADKVISAVGAKATVNNLLPEKIKEQDWSKKINKLGQSPCHLCLYLGFEGDITQAGATASNQWFFETWDPENDTWDVRDPKSEAPVLYVSFPSLKDPNHPGQEKNLNTGEVVTFVPWEAFEKWKDSHKQKRPDDYKAFKKDIEQRMLNQFFRHMPHLKDKMVYCELSTPVSTTHYCRAPQGAIYGLSPTPERFMCEYLRPQTPIKGLYMTGSDIGTLGVIGAMIGGALTASKINPKVAKHIT